MHIVAPCLACVRYCQATPTQAAITATADPCGASTSLPPNKHGLASFEVTTEADAIEKAAKQFNQYAAKLMACGVHRSAHSFYAISSGKAIHSAAITAGNLVSIPVSKYYLLTVNNIFLVNAPYS